MQCGGEPDGYRPIGQRLVLDACGRDDVVVEVVDETGAEVIEVDAPSVVITVDNPRR